MIDQKGLFSGDAVFPHGFFGWLVGLGLGLPVFLNKYLQHKQKHNYMAIEGNFKNRQGH